MTKKAAGAAAVRKCAAGVLFFVSVALVSCPAFAEKIIASVDGWDVYTDGRVGGFVSYIHGDGFPQNAYGYDATGAFVGTAVHTPLQGIGLFGSPTVQHYAIDPSVVPGGIYDQGTIDTWRLRSGFIPNVFGFGVRGHVSDDTTVTGYIQIWAYVENQGRAKGQQNPLDARQGYAKIEGPWGSVMAGRTRGLFSRGASDINVMYAHRWGVGWPGSGNNGPTQGMVGFGVLGSGFSSSVIYGTPVIAGFKLDIGLFDPAVLPATGSFTRTTFPRPEAELTFEQGFDGGKVVVFVNGAYQKVYKDGQCDPVIDPQTKLTLPCDQTVAGFGAGARLEVGPFHLGVAGHYGEGLGTSYALQSDQASQDMQGNPRKLSGAYVQTQVVIQKVDLFAGWGIVQIYLSEFDKLHTHADPRDTTGNTQAAEWSIPKYQMGINAGVVYNVSPFVHIDLDLFRAQAGWYGANGFPAEKQVVYVANSGMMVNW